MAAKAVAHQTGQAPGIYWHGKDTGEISASCRPAPVVRRVRRRHSSGRFTERADDLGIAIASQNDLIVGRGANNQVRQLKTLLPQAQADDREAGVDVVIA